MIIIFLERRILESIDQLVKDKVFPNRSKTIQNAIEEKISRFNRSRLAKECSKLDVKFEQSLAEEGMTMEIEEWSGILRGDIIWADLNPVRGKEQAGKRPVRIISKDIFNERSGTVIAIAITSQLQKAGFLLTYEMPGDIFPKKSWIKINQIRTLSIEQLENKISRISIEDLDKIIDGLNEIIGS